MTSDVGFWRRWLELQARHNFPRLLEQSVKDFHFRGFNYVCLQFEPFQTVRLYVLDPEQPVDVSQTSVHNHLYDSQLLCLLGYLRNTVYRVDDERGERYHAHWLRSALHPENAERRIKLQPHRPVGLSVASEKTLLPGQWHYQPHTEVHSVSSDPSLPTAWMVFEFPTVKDRSTVFLRGEGERTTIETPGCYGRFGAEELSRLLGRLFSWMDGRSA
jgi:hypothetical protein